jgi:hypothetical protein
MAENDPYRDALSAAHARISDLERERAETKKPNAARLGALHRERARAVASLGEPDLAGLLRWKIYVPFAVASFAFALDGDWIVAAMAPVLAVAVRLVARAIVASNRKAAVRQIELLDVEIAKLDQDDRAT